MFKVGDIVESIKEDSFTTVGKTYKVIEIGESKDDGMFAIIDDDGNKLWVYSRNIYDDEITFKKVGEQDV